MQSDSLRARLLCMESGSAWFLHHPRLAAVHLDLTNGLSRLLWSRLGGCVARQMNALAVGSRPSVMCEQKFVELGIELQGDGLRVDEMLDREADVDRDHCACKVVGRHRGRRALLGVRGGDGLGGCNPVDAPEGAGDFTESLVAACVGK